MTGLCNVSAPDTPQTPIVKIKGNPVLSYCDKLELSGLTTIGLSGITHWQWSFNPALTSFPDQFNFNQPSISLNPEYIPVGVTTVSLVVTTGFGETGSVFIDVTKYNNDTLNTEKPQIKLSTPMHVTIRKSQPLVVEALAYPGSCTSWTHDTFSYHWKSITSFTSMLFFSL